MKENIFSNDLLKIQYWFFMKQKINYLLLLAFLMAGVYGLHQGFAFKAKQIAAIQLFRDDKNKNLNVMIEGFYADTTKAEGKTAYKKVTSPNSSNWYITLPAYKMPITTAIYSIGQGDVFPYYYTIKIESFFMQLFKQGEIANPLRSLVGHFDISFWIIYLLPLLILILCFNALSAELDNGNWRLINSQGVSARQWLQSKFLLVGLCIAILLLIVFVGGIILNYFYFNQTPAFNDVLFFISASLYLIFWLSIIYLINASGASTSINALYSGILWIAICIVMPALVTTLVEKTVAVDNITVSCMSRRPQGSKFDDDAFGVKTIKQLGEQQTQYKQASVKTTSAGFRLAVYMAYHELLDDTNKVEVQRYFHNIEKRQTLTNASCIINPAAATDGIFSGLAANDAFANHQFVWQIKAFHEKLHKAYFPALFFDRSLQISDYKNFPVFKNEVAKSISIMTFVNLVLLLSLIFISVTLANKKLENYY